MWWLLDLFLNTTLLLTCSNSEEDVPRLEDSGIIIGEYFFVAKDWPYVAVRHSFIERYVTDYLWVQKGYLEEYRAEKQYIPVFVCPEGSTKQYQVVRGAEKKVEFVLVRETG